MRRAERSNSKSVYLISTCLIALWGGSLGLRDHRKGINPGNLGRILKTYPGRPGQDALLCAVWRTSAVVVGLVG